MITIISLVNICYINTKEHIYFLVMRTCRVHSLSNFQIYCTEGLSVVIFLYLIPPVLIYLIIGSTFFGDLYSH